MADLNAATKRVPISLLFRDSSTSSSVASHCRTALSILCFFTIIGGTPVVATADENPEFGNPSDGQEFGLEDNVEIEFDSGKQNTTYTIRVVRIGGGYDQGFNANTDGEGNYSSLEFSGGTLAEAEYIVQLREGANNTTGASEDQISFYVIDQSES